MKTGGQELIGKENKKGLDTKSNPFTYPASGSPNGELRSGFPIYCKTRSVNVVYSGRVARRAPMPAGS